MFDSSTRVSKNKKVLIHWKYHLQTKKVLVVYLKIK